MDPVVKKQARDTLYDASIIAFTMIAAVMAAEGRMPDVSRIAKFLAVFVALVAFLRLNHEDVAKQIMTAVSIGCGSKLLEIITRK